MAWVLPNLGGTVGPDPDGKNWFATVKQGIGFNLFGGNQTLGSLDERIEAATGSARSDVVIGRIGDDLQRDGTNDRAGGAFGPDLLIGDTEGGHKSPNEFRTTITGVGPRWDGLGDVIFGD